MAKNSTEKLADARPALPMRIGAVLISTVFLVTSATAKGHLAGYLGLAASAAQYVAIAPSASDVVRLQLEGMTRRASGSSMTLSDFASDQARLRTLRDELRTERAEALKEFDSADASLAAVDLPRAIRDRQRDSRRQFVAQAEMFESYLARLQSARTVDAIRRELALVQGKADQLRTERRQQEFDPETLPFGRSKQPRRAPRAKNADYASWNLAPSGGGFLGAASALQFAALAAPSPADLQGTEEVVLSPEVQALAASLGHDPIKIYEWVYENIRYIPSYGSIQGSEGTLRTRRGNAIDTASLLIALLRSSGIPARYVFGTVDIPIDKAQNWVGGVTSPNAALDLLAQGNVAVQGLAQAGRITLARMEHAWVEAYVDFVPSRGVKNFMPDSWIPMDASFKQYTFSNGVDAVAAPPAQELPTLNQLASRLVIDETTGRMAGLETQDARAVYDEATTIVDNYVAGPPGSEEPRVRRVDVNMRLLPVLPSGLPYKVVATSAGVPVVPAPARRAFQVTIYRSVADRNNGNPAFTFTRNLSQLSGKRLSIAFLPATADDAAALASFLPAPGPDGTIHPSALRKTIPGYLIRLNAVALLDGVEVARANDFVLGQELGTRLSIQRLSGEWYHANNINVAGEYLAISLDLQGVGSDPQEKISAQTPDNLLHQAGSAYWASLDHHLWALESMGGAVAVRQPSFGVFSTVFQPTYRYGIPTAVRLAGVSVDVDASFTSMMAFDGDDGRTIRAVEQNGLIASALEHEVPQVYLADTADSARGASSVSAMAAAVAGNQSIFHVTEGNWPLVRPLLAQSPEIIQDIERAVGSGLEVLVSQSAVEIDGWRGAGYIIQDPETGSGAYRISGGQNGGAMDSDVSSGLTMLGLGIVGALFIPVVKADSGGCENDDGARRQVQVDWKLMLTLALIMAMLAALIAGSGGLGGVVIGTGGRKLAAKAISAVLCAFAPLAAYAGGDTGGCYTFYLGTITANSTMHQHNAHVRSAINSGKPSTLTYAGPLTEYTDGWYNKYPECSAIARAAYPGTPGCDEYPFKSAWEGGETNYLAGKVSLLIIDRKDNSTGGGALSGFVYACNLRKGSRYKVEPTTGLSRGTDKNGNTCYTAASP